MVLGLFFGSRGGTLRQPLLVPDLLCFSSKSLQNLEVAVVRVEAVSDMSGQLTALNPVLVGQVGLLTSESVAAGVEKAKEGLASGAGLEKLDAWIAATKALGK